MKFPSFFAKKEKKIVGNPKDTGLTSSSLYSGSAFYQYNPDDLIGRKGSQIYRRMLLDDQVKAVYRFRRNSVIARSYRFEFGNTKLSDTEQEARIKIFEEILTQLRGSFKDALIKIASGIAFGFSMTEKIHKLINVDGRPWMGLDRLRLRPFQSFIFNTDKHANIIKVIQRIGVDTVDIKMEKFIHYVQNPDFNEHYGASELMEAHRDWFSKEAMISFRNIWLERHASGFYVASPKEGFSFDPNSQVFKDMKDILLNLNTKTGVILPEGVELEFFKPEHNVNYSDAIIASNKGISKALLVPDLIGISEGAGSKGGFSQASIQLRAYLWTVEADVERMEDTLDEQLFTELGDLNWGDGDYPKFKFNPLSKDELVTLANTWGALVGTGAVIASDTDEARLREMLDMPERGDDLIKPEEEEKEADPEGEGTEEEEAKPQEKEATPLGDGKDDSEGVKAKKKVTGAAVFARAVERVAFAVVASNAAILEEEATEALGAALSMGVNKIVALLHQNADLRDNPSIIAEVKFDGRNTRKLKMTLKELLDQGWRLGINHATREIDKAQRQVDFSRRIDFRALDEAAARFFEAKAFVMAGKLSEDAIAIVRNVISQGIKASATTREITDNIYTELAVGGFLGIRATEQIKEGMTGEAKERLGVLLDTRNVRARLETVVRTNLFEAINEARFSFFNDPVLNGYVEALEYSAILDGRTTAICLSLDDSIYPINSPFWDRYRPPNHFQCRSLLVAVTRDDEWAESLPPVVAPAAGFG